MNWKFSIRCHTISGGVVKRHIVLPRMWGARADATRGDVKSTIVAVGRPLLYKPSRLGLASQLTTCSPDFTPTVGVGGCTPKSKTSSRGGHAACNKSNEACNSRTRTSLVATDDWTASRGHRMFYSGCRRRANICVLDNGRVASCRRLRCVC